MDDINDRGELRIALEADTPPFNFKDDGKLTGFEVELGQLLASELDVRADFVVTEAAELLPGVESGKFDVAINHIAMTPELKDRFDFSEPYSYSSAQLIVRKEEQRPLFSLQALRGQALGWPRAASSSIRRGLWKGSTCAATPMPSSRSRTWRTSRSTPPSAIAC
ncbi:hypothetical protein PBOI14_73620 [Pseudomonas sp. Boi14]|nr:hypothetical protein PBOI14_73620 [Pseudomonas sp. Boi14]